MNEQLMTASLSDEAKKEFFAALALRHCKRLGVRTLARLLRRYGSAYAVYRHLSAGGGDGKVPFETMRDLRNGGWRSEAEREWSAASMCPGKVVLWTDAAYPSLLREIPDAPIFLYARGDVELLKGPCVAVVGTRRASAEGLRATSVLATGLAASGITVVSGLARGVDAAAHTAAMSLPGGTLAVLGTGIDIVYPQENRNIYEEIRCHGLLVSEYAPGTDPTPARFPARNRIISGLSLGVIVTEAAPGSGSLITAHDAAEQNRAVYAVGGPIGSSAFSGCQELIRQGALSVFSAADVLCDLKDQLEADMDEPSLILSGDVTNEGMARRKPGRKGHHAETAGRPASVRDRILIGLASVDSRTSDDLCELLALTPAEVSAALVLLEVEGVVTRHQDGGYSLV